MSVGGERQQGDEHGPAYLLVPGYAAGGGRMPGWLLVLVMACGGGSPTSGDPGPAEPPPIDAAVGTEPGTELPALVTPTEAKYAATHVLVAWTGAVRAPASVTRTEVEARALAEELRGRALAGESLEELAKEYSDGAAAPRGGQLGVYLTGTMVPDFEAAVAAVDVGEIGPPVKTPFGWHVVRRDPVVEVAVSHILVTWGGAWRSGSRRTKEEARVVASEALAQLESGTPFADVAAAYSDDSTASHGGDLGVIAPGQMIPDFEAVAFGLEPGQHSQVVETPYGFHLVLRTK